jgi:hypothetical protein
MHTVALFAIHEIESKVLKNDRFYVSQTPKRHRKIMAAISNNVEDAIDVTRSVSCFLPRTTVFSAMGP